MTEVLEKFAPEAHKNMSKTEPTQCNLGTRSAFCSMTMVSDFTANQHTDKNDVCDGATALLTLLKMMKVKDNIIVFLGIKSKVHNPKKLEYAEI